MVYYHYVLWSMVIYGGFHKWGYLQIAHGKIRFIPMNHPAIGYPNYGNPHVEMVQNVKIGYPHSWLVLKQTEKTRGPPGLPC